ncbi:MAG: hypothetical protein FJ095_17620 [Deltaproteobacteria bacterium]|nr:hypothetical protein [Deltaproteobacteria bacterium]
MPDVNVQAEIEQRFAEVTGQRGVPGRVVIHGRAAELHGAGAVVSIDVGEMLDQWSILPEDMRAAQLQAAVDRLRSAVAAALPPPPETTDVAPIVGKVVGALIALAMVAGGVFWLVRANFFGSKAASLASSAVSTAPVSTADVIGKRERESCESSRRRLYAGATALDVDPAGWVIELWLAREANPTPLSDDPIVKETTHAVLSPRLGALTPASATWLETGEVGRARLRFEGGYLQPFMQAEGRDRFVSLIDQLADATRADHAALFAHCAHSNVRDVGAYFRGRDAAGAAATLLFAQGLFTDPPSVDRAKLGGDANALGALVKATSGMEAPAVEELIRDNGGRVITHDGAGRGAYGLSFALGGPTRAQQAARALSKERKLN